MILRNSAARHGRRALAAATTAATPTTRSPTLLRPISTSASRQSPAPTTLAEPPTAPTPAEARAAAEAFAAAQLAARQAELARIPANFAEYEHQRAVTRTLGSRVTSRYYPDEHLDNPPADASLEMLMAAQAHMGHHVSQWNPGNQRYIYGVRAGIHIISLETTASHLRRAARVVEEVAFHGGLILFVGTRKGQMAAVVKAAELAQGCHLFTKWLPGSITNRDVLLAQNPLKIVGERDQELAGFDKHLRDRRPVIPDLVVCLNPLENQPLLHECGLANVPTIGVIDTDADPTWVTYQIPANDDSLRSTTLIAGVLGRAGERGQQRRLELANDGIVSWQNPAEVDRFIKRDTSEKMREFEELNEKAQAEGDDFLKEGKSARPEDNLGEDELLQELLETVTLPSQSK